MTLLQGYIVFTVVAFIILVWYVFLTQEVNDHE